MVFHVFNRYGERTLKRAAHATAEIILVLVV